MQHSRLPCPSPTTGAYSNAYTLSQWCCPTIKSSVLPFASCLRSFPESGSFQMSQFFTACGQSIGVSASASVLPMNIQDWFPLGWTGWISLLSKRLKSLLQHHSSKASVLWHSALYSPTLTSLHDYWKNHIFDYMDLFWQSNVSAFQSAVCVGHSFLPRNKCLLISWLQSPSAVTLQPRKVVSHCFHCFTTYLPWSDGTGCHDLNFLNVEF